jgi:hypothetical protein
MPAFLSVPAIKPRTVWGCQSVASWISWLLAPFLRWSRRSTVPFFVPARAGLASAAAAFLAQPSRFNPTAL